MISPSIIVRVFDFSYAIEKIDRGIGSVARSIFASGASTKHVLIYAPSPSIPGIEAKLQ